MCLISALATVTSNVTFTTGIYIAPVRDLITTWRPSRWAPPPSCPTTGFRLGVGVGWCEEEFIQTGQDFHHPGQAV